jgi:hypothetical protein
VDSSISHLDYQPKLKALTEVPLIERDGLWAERFCRQLVVSQVSLIHQQSQLGPDGWPYIMVEVGGSEPVSKILQWLSRRGIGLTVGAKNTQPDFVFSYGMIWHFVEFGFFFHYNESEKAPELSTSVNADSVKCGAPNPKYLPGYVRTILKQFFIDQGILDPRIQMISWDAGKTYDLAFSETSVGTLTPTDQQKLVESISWFLPPHYGLAVVSPEGLPPFLSL